MQKDLNSAIFLNKFFVHACWLLKELNLVLQKWSESQSAAVYMKGLYTPVTVAGFCDVQRWEQEKSFQNVFNPYCVLNVNNTNENQTNLLGEIKYIFLWITPLCSELPNHFQTDHIY